MLLWMLTYILKQITVRWSRYQQLTGSCCVKKPWWRKSCVLSGCRRGSNFRVLRRGKPVEKMVWMNGQFRKTMKENVCSCSSFIRVHFTASRLQSRSDYLLMLTSDQHVCEGVLYFWEDLAEWLFMNPEILFWLHHRPDIVVWTQQELRVVAQLIHLNASSLQRTSRLLNGPSMNPMTAFCHLHCLHITADQLAERSWRQKLCLSLKSVWFYEHFQIIVW